LIRLGAAQRGIWSSIGRVRRLRSTLQRERPGTVISFLTKINVITLLATIGLRLRVVVSERNNPRQQTAHALWPWLLARLYPRADAIVIQTEASRICLPSSVAPHAIVIPNPIAAIGVHSEVDSTIVTAVGRLEYQKGFDLLLQAFALAAPRHPDWRLQIWGEGPLRHELEAAIAALGLANKASLGGLTATPGGWLATAGVFVLSSRYEGFPNALGEAMAAAIPAIAFDCDFGPADMIADNHNGLLVPAGDVVAMAAALDRLLDDAALRRRLGSAAQTAAAQYAPDAIFMRWQAVVAGL
jgi:glycosyltransferase involved in cell wall biosynthesis